MYITRKDLLESLKKIGDNAKENLEVTIVGVTALLMYGYDVKNISTIEIDNTSDIDVYNDLCKLYGASEKGLTGNGKEVVSIDCKHSWNCKYMTSMGNLTVYVPDKVSILAYILKTHILTGDIKPVVDRLLSEVVKYTTMSDLRNALIRLGHGGWTFFPEFAEHYIFQFYSDEGTSLSVEEVDSLIRLVKDSSCNVDYFVPKIKNAIYQRTNDYLIGSDK